MARKSQNQARSARPEDGCESGDNLPLRAVSSFDFRPCEIEWLHMFRMMLARPVPASNDAWLAIHARAERQFGDQAAQLILGATTALIRALKLERPHPFYFVSPECTNCRERLCEDEFLVMCAVVSARCGDNEQLKLAARWLTQSGSMTGFCRRPAHLRRS